MFVKSIFTKAFALATLCCSLGLPCLEGNDKLQVLHSHGTNRPYMESEPAKEFVFEKLQGAKECYSDAETLRFASDSVCIDGEFIEAGVWRGRTINFLAALNPSKTIHGFDSFEGMPEDWHWETGVIPKDIFAIEDNPLFLLNVSFHKGWFKDSLPEFQNTYLMDRPIAFLHVDCCLYSSTKDVFKALEGNLASGSIIAFDEYYNYPGCQHHEMKAFEEFLEESGFEAEYIAYNANHEQVVVRLR